MVRSRKLTGIEYQSVRQNTSRFYMRSASWPICSHSSVCSHGVPLFTVVEVAFKTTSVYYTGRTVSQYLKSIQQHSRIVRTTNDRYHHGFWIIATITPKRARWYRNVNDSKRHCSGASRQTRWKLESTWTPSRQQHHSHTSEEQSCTILVTGWCSIAICINLRGDRGWYQRFWVRWGRQ